MNKKVSVACAIACLVLIGALAYCVVFANKLNVQDLAVVQAFTGETVVRREAGWWIQMSPTIWRYPRAGVYQLNSRDRDLLDIQFKNKSTAKLKANIGYRIDGSTDEQIVALHQQVEGEEEKIWQMMLTALNTVAQSITTKYDPSDVIGGDKFEEMIQEIYREIVHNKELKAHGIDVNYFAVDGRPIPDAQTEEQFNKQKEADLAKRLAEAEKLKLESEKIRVEAQYQKEIAEYKGKADAETAKLVTEAERTKRLAAIEASKKVEVEKLAKEELLVKMNKEKEAAEIEVEKQKAVAKIEAEKLLEVARIQKETEAAKLEAEKLVAEQKKVAAEAKKTEIEKSGAVTELQRLQIVTEKETRIGVAEAYAKGISGAKLPQMWVSGGSPDGAKAQNPLELLISTMTLEKLSAVAERQSEKSVKPAK
jgi:hypothetical protein